MQIVLHEIVTALFNHFTRTCSIHLYRLMIQCCYNLHLSLRGATTLTYDLASSTSIQNGEVQQESVKGAIDLHAPPQKNQEKIVSMFFITRKHNLRSIQGDAVATLLVSFLQALICSVLT